MNKISKDSDLIFLYYLEEYKKIRHSKKYRENMLVALDSLMPFIITALATILIFKIHDFEISNYLILCLPSIVVGITTNYIMIICGYEGLLYRKFSEIFNIEKQVENIIYKGDFKKIFYEHSKNLKKILNLNYFYMECDVKKYGGLRWQTVRDIVDASKV